LLAVLDPKAENVGQPAWVDKKLKIHILKDDFNKNNQKVLKDNF
jgi:hypothetical protein